MIITRAEAQQALVEFYGESMLLAENEKQFTRLTTQYMVWADVSNTIITRGTFNEATFTPTVQDFHNFRKIAHEVENYGSYARMFGLLV